MESNDNNSLEHFGVLGMKWGVRKNSSGSDKKELVGLGSDRIELKTKSGDKIILEKNPPNVMNKAFAKVSKKYVDSYNNGAFLTIKGKDGKKVGTASVMKRSNEELYLNWIGINKSARGNGYASAALKAAEEFGAQSGFKKMTLEVPGNAPDARHIYENLGFKVVKEGDPTNDPYWGGLTEMVYTFDNVKHDGLNKSAINDFNLNDEYGWLALGIKKYADENSTFFGDDMADSNDLQHFGVQGMKWGVRKRSAKEEKERAKRFKELKNRRTLSDEELKARIDRLSAEKKFKQLTEEDLTPGRAVASRILSESGQRVASKVVVGAGTVAVGYAVKHVLKQTKYKGVADKVADTIQRGGLKK